MQEPDMDRQELNLPDGSDEHESTGDDASMQALSDG
jgi:hypothetical protein